MNKLILIFFLFFINTQYGYSSSDSIVGDTSNQQKFEGYQVKFDYENYPEEREIAYQYYLDHKSKNLEGIKKEELGIDLYDIDGDGQKEIFIYVNGGDRCPRAGCPFAILMKCKDGKYYKEIPWFTEKGASMTMYKNYGIKILNSFTVGYQDILLGKKDKGFAIWQWNGKFYNLKEVLKQHNN